MRGWVAAAALGIALALAGGVFDAEPLFVGGIAFALLGLTARAWVGLAARGARIDRELSAHRTVEGEPVQVRLRAVAGAPVPGGRVLEPLLEGPAPLRAARRITRIRIEARFARRGLRRLAPARMALHDPLRLAGRTVEAGGGGDELLVLPRVEPVEVSAAPDGSGSGRALAALAGIAEVEVDGLRAYRPGTPASRIHWAPLARGEDLLERRLRPDADGRPLVVLDPRGGGEDELDAAVRAAASLARTLAERSGCALLLPGERRAARLERDLGAWPAAWARLALVQPGGAPPLGGLAARLGPVFYVTAGPALRLPRSLLRAGGPRLVVTPAAQPGRAALFTVAGCHGYALRALRSGAGRAA